MILIYCLGLFSVAYMFSWQCLCFVIGMAKVLPIVDISGYDGMYGADVLSYDGHSHNYISMNGYIGFHNMKRLLTLTCS